MGTRFLDQSNRTIAQLAFLTFLFCVLIPGTLAQINAIHGTVGDASGKPVAGATVTLQPEGSAPPIETLTDDAGIFAFLPPTGGSYQIRAAKDGLRSNPATADETSMRKGAQINLTLNAASTLGPPMEFADQPNFTVAGVTDWTAVGGHGSDSTLRTSEDLARETAALKAQDAGDHATTSRAQSAEQHRRSADKDERSGDPLAALHEYEQAVRLDPSEQNYFAWGSELLLHRAVWQAVEVFRNGSRLHPGSARMLTALGSALFAGDLLDESAASLCAGSDLQPAEIAPYSFMGRVAIASPTPLGCVEPRLARFAQLQPQNATANYLYAMAIWKRQEHSPQPQDVERVKMLLSKAVAIDPRCAEAWLQLGILAAAQHRSEEAIRDYSRAIAADPQSGEAHYRLGVAYDRSGAAEQARREFALHDEIEKSQAAAVERQRKEVKQFLVVLEKQPVPGPALR